VIGWAAWAAVFGGNYLIGNKDARGFLLALSGGVLLAIHAVAMRDWSLVAANAAFMVLHSRNYLRWRREPLSTLEGE
jgi:hypothetical protein